jgi:hypothetical protein
MADWLQDAITNTAQQFGIDPNVLSRTVQIESSGNPNAATGSYKGLLQLSNDEFQKYAPGGDIFNPVDNLRAGAAKMVAEMRGFADKYGREPTPTDYYLTHQQGVGGLREHLTNPEGAAWLNMYNTAEGQRKGVGWAKKAIWGNIPDSEKRRFGDVEKVSSRDFYNLWQNKVEGQGAAGMPAQAQPPSTGAIGGTSPPTASAGNSGGVGGLLARMLGTQPSASPSAGVLGIPAAAPRMFSSGLMPGLAPPQFLQMQQLQAPPQPQPYFPNRQQPMAMPLPQVQIPRLGGY